MNGSPRKLLRPRPPTARSLSQTWLEAFARYAGGECHLAENTVAAYRHDLGRFFEWLEGGAIPDLTIRDLADYATWLHAQKLAPASIARHIVSLKVFLRYLQLEGVVRENLAELLGSQKLWERVPKVLSPQQVARLLDSPSLSDPFGAVIGRCWSCSMPRGAARRSCRACACAMCVCKRASALAGARETRSGVVPLGGRAIAAVEAYLEHEREVLAGRVDPPPQWLLLSYRGRRLRRERIWELVKRYAGRVGAARRQPAHPAAQLCHAHACRWRRSTPGAGDARPREYFHHPALHPRRSAPTQGRPQEVPPSGLSGLGSGSMPTQAWA